MFSNHARKRWFAKLASIRSGESVRLRRKRETQILPTAKLLIQTDEQLHSKRGAPKTSFQKKGNYKPLFILDRPFNGIAVQRLVRCNGWLCGGEPLFLMKCSSMTSTPSFFPNGKILSSGQPSFLIKCQMERTASRVISCDGVCPNCRSNRNTQELNFGKFSSSRHSLSSVTSLLS